MAESPINHVVGQLCLSYCSSNDAMLSFGPQQKGYSSESGSDLELSQKTLTELCRDWRVKTRDLKNVPLLTFTAVNDCRYVCRPSNIHELEHFMLEQGVPALMLRSSHTRIREVHNVVHKLNFFGGPSELVGGGFRVKYDRIS